MAASYVSSSNPASATSAVDLRTALDAVILAHSNWSLVEAISITGGTARVYKCSGAANAAGLDFYFALIVLTASPNLLIFSMFESYTANGGATSTAVRSIRNTGTAFTAAPNAQGGYVVDNTAYTLDNAGVVKLAMSLNASDIVSWACHVSKSRIAVCVKSPTGGGMQGFNGGVYVQNSRVLSSINSVFPLFMALSGNNSSLLTGPGATANPGFIYFSRGYGVSTNMGQGGAHCLSSVNACGQIATNGAYIDPVEGVLRGTGIVVYGGQSAPNSGQGFLRGSLPGAYGFYTSSSSYPQPGDIVLLSDGTQLMIVGTPMSGFQAALYVDIASDN